MCNKDGEGGMGGGQVESGWGKRERGCGVERLRERERAEFIDNEQVRIEGVSRFKKFSGEWRDVDCKDLL